MKNCLANLYEVSLFDVILCYIVRKIRGTINPPQWLYRYSLKKYGAKDNLIRYFIDQYAGLPIGKYTWGIKYANSKFVKSIGAFCSIASDLHIAPNGHRTDYFTTWNTLITHEFDKPVEKSIEIGNDVWIGTNCTILTNVKIGNGAVLAAGSIITKDVPPYAIVVGVNRIIKYIFSDDVCKMLANTRWWEWEDDIIFKSFEYKDNVEKFLEVYS